jgi:hypothetical protein
MARVEPEKDSAAAAAPTPPRTLVFASEIIASISANAVAGNIALPSVTIPAGLIAGTILRVTAGVSWRKQVESSGSPNAVDGAQEIQVRSDTPGTFRNAINLADNSLATALDATEGGSMIEGDEDISVEVTGPDTYEFQWTSALVDGASLTLHDVGTWLFVQVEN